MISRAFRAIRLSNQRHHSQFHRACGRRFKTTRLSPFSVCSSGKKPTWCWGNIWSTPIDVSITYGVYDSFSSGSKYLMLFPHTSRAGSGQSLLESSTSLKPRALRTQCLLPHWRNEPIYRDRGNGIQNRRSQRFVPFQTHLASTWQTNPVLHQANKELHLHLFELAHAENELTGLQSHYGSALPICAIPKGIFSYVCFCTLR